MEIGAVMITLVKLHKLVFCGLTKPIPVFLLATSVTIKKIRNRITLTIDAANVFHGHLSPSTVKKIFLRGD